MIPNPSLVQFLAQQRNAIATQGLPDYEQLLEQRYTQWIQPGHVVLDVGAHRGRHLSRFIDLVGSKGRVLAFEPLQHMFQYIQSQYHAPNVAFYNIALSDQRGSTEFVYNENAPEESGLRERIYNQPKHAKLRKFECQMERLDNVVMDLERIDFIKLDIEGAEISCLNGAVNALKKFRPLVSVEYGYPSYSVYNLTRSSLFDFSELHGFVLYDLYLHSLQNRADWEIACDSVYWDFLMVPLERESSFLQALQKS